MTLWLKQSTAAVLSFGPFLDKTDGVTEETGLVSALDHGTTGIKLSKNGGAMTIRHASVTATTYDAYGMYRVTLDTTDTNTLGTLRMAFNEAATCLPVWQDFMVLPANIYDSIVSGSDLIDVSMAQILGTAVSSPATAGVLDVNLKNIANAAVSTSSAQLGVNVVNAGATAWGSGAITAASIAADAITAAKIAAGAIGASELAADAVTEIAAGVSIPSAATIASQVRTELTAELGRIDVATSTRLATAGYTAPLDAAGTRTAIGLATANLDTQLGAIAGYIDTEVDAIYTRIGAPVGASISADIAGISAGSGLDAAGVRAAIGLSSANLDTQLAAELAQATLARKLLKNRTETNPATGVMTVYDDDGVTPLYTANLYEDTAGATAYDGTAGVNRRNALS
jgi:hypothetical protein